MYRNGIRKRKYKIAVILTVLVDICALIAVVFLMNYMQSMLSKDIEVNLKEIVIQNQQVITSKLNLELTELTGYSKVMAKEIESDPDFKDITYQTALINYCDNEDKEKEHNIFITKYYDGIFEEAEVKNAFFYDNKVLDVRFRDYYIMAVSGKSNIRFIESSRVDSKPMFILSVPIYIKGEIIGALHKFLTPVQMNEICSLSRFSSQGFMHIINSNGDIVVQSENFVYNQGDKKFFRILTINENLQASEQLKSDIEKGNENFMEVNFNKEPYYCAYTPIENLDDWFLISSISVNEISSNSNSVVVLFYIIMLIIVIIAGVSVFLFLLYKNKQQSYIEKIAFVDSVTLGNTLAKFTLEYNNIVSGNPDKNYSIMVFDVDNFKYVNSYYGYEFGDRVLKTIYDKVHAKLFESEVMARVSGDHFIALINQSDEKRIYDLLNIESIDGKSIFMSAGIYNIADVNESISLMLDKASIAVQSVKTNLHEKVGYYSREYDETVKHYEQLKRAISHALIQGEIIPYFQPKVDINSRKIIGAEALARWRKSDGSMISPAEFVPLCEKTGQIVDVDMAIFEQTLMFLSDKLKKGIPCLPISVNFSRINLKNQMFVHEIVNKLKDYDVPAELLQIEITESAVFEDYAVIAEFVRHLHIHGLVICIDDFGSGYSSLNMLKDIPVDVLKVDKAFLNTKNNVERQDIILSVIAQMAEKLGMEVVIEGVETLENVDLMRKIGCTIAQGYYFARPMNEKDFEVLFIKGEV